MRSHERHEGPIILKQVSKVLGRNGVYEADFVDDDEQVFQMLRFLLKKDGIELVRASDGLEAKKLMSTKGGFDLLIVDVFMQE